MPQTIEEFLARTLDDVLRDMPPELLLSALPADKRLEGLSLDELSSMLTALSPEDRVELARRLTASAGNQSNTTANTGDLNAE